MLDHCGTEERKQECLNSLANGLYKALNRATEVGEVGPPQVSEEDLLDITIFGAHATVSEIDADAVSHQFPCLFHSG